VPTLKQRLGQKVFARLPITRFLFDQLRAEANAWLVGVQSRFPPRRAALRARRSGRDLYVNVACGPNALPGFVNLDLYATAPGVFRWDCRWDLPLEDGAAAGIRVEHFFEHLEPREEAPHFLRDCHRALRPSGVLRVIVPDAARYVEAYCHGDWSAFHPLGVGDPPPADLPTRMDIVNHVFHQWHEHRWAYDFENLWDRLRCAGFAAVRRARFQVSLDPLLAADAAQHSAYSLYVDAVKAAPEDRTA
jgi:predicted SAM-dependent methyltransferase